MEPRHSSQRAGRRMAAIHIIREYDPDPVRVVTALVRLLEHAPARPNQEQSAGVQPALEEVSRDTTTHTPSS